MSKHVGGCFCGDVSFEIAVDPMLEFQCHCSDCQVLYGSSLNACAFNKEEVDIIGKLENYAWVGGSGEKISRNFCPTCGVSIYAEPELLDGMIYMPIGILRHQENLSPRLELWTGSKPNWMEPPKTLQESFVDNGTIERISMLLENLDQRQK